METNYAQQMLDALSSGQLDDAKNFLHNHYEKIVMI